MQFAYQARDAQGQVRAGQIAAASMAEATRALKQDGLFLLSLVEKASSGDGSGYAWMQPRIPRSEIIYVTSQLAIMVESGVPVATALDGLARQTPHQGLGKLLRQVQKDVEAGDDLSVALGKYPKYFDRTYVNLIKASEASGLLAPMLERIAERSRADLEIRQKVRGALAYPATMLALCVGVCVFLMAYVFPKLTPMFESRGVKLPLPTRILVACSHAVTHYPHWLILVLIAIVGFVLFMRKQWWGRRAIDFCWLNLPILGPMLRKVIISRSLRTLATTIGAGVPVLDAIRLSANVAGNVFYEECWLKANEQVSTGKPLHIALEGSTLIPATLVQMIAAGESTGKLGHVLGKVSDYYDSEVNNAVKSATALIEPMMVCVMGTVIGSVSLAMLLPIFKLSGHSH